MAMNQTPIYILGGYQSDFARNWSREDLTISDLFIDTVRTGLSDAKLEPAEIEVGHVGNFVAPLYTGQAHLGGFFGHVDPAMAYMPASSHEAACASGSMALMAAMSNLESGRYGLACVAGIEMMRTGDLAVQGDNLRGAAWVGKEWAKAGSVWPCAFSDLIGEYEKKYGLDKAHLNVISKKAFDNARRNPNAQSRHWSFSDESFSDNDELNPVISGNIRRQDCGQVTDGAAVLFLATQEKAQEYANRRGLALESIPRIKGWGHINAPLLFQEKMRLAQEQPYLFPHIRTLFEQTLARAGLSDINAVDGMEVHDCFNITEYMIVDHTGLYAPGEAWKAIEEGVTQPDGALPVNVSGGLIGVGHPVGSTGVRMALDCYKQVTETSDGLQIDGAKNMMTFNLGGSTTTCASLVVGL